MLVLFKQKTHILQISFVKFQNESDAASSIIKIAEKYHNNEITKEELKPQRDVMINDFFEAQGGRSRPQGKILKRNASANRAEMETATEAMTYEETASTHMAEALCKPPPSPPSRVFHVA